MKAYGHASLSGDVRARSVYNVAEQGKGTIMLGEMWAWKKIIIFCIPFALVLFGLLVWLFLRKTIRTRFRMARQLRDDPDIHEWLVVFGWSRKVLYVPMIIVSLIAFGVTLATSAPLVSRITGGCWLGVFFLNFLIDEYEMSIKVLMLFILCFLVLGLWLVFMDWLEPFIRFFRHLGISISAMGYLMIAMVFALAVAISWIRGLFYYVAITPNYLNLQVGPTETGEQISREEYSTRIDTGDFLERLLGFGRIIVTFSDQRRIPLVLLISRIGKRAKTLESIRGKLTFDLHQPMPEE